MKGKHLLLSYLALASLLTFALANASMSNADALDLADKQANTLCDKNNEPFNECRNGEGEEGAS